MMKWNRLIRLIVLSSSCLVAIPVTCNSIFAKRSQSADADEYEYVTESGTHVQKRVKKNTYAKDDPGAGTMSAEQFRRATEMAHKVPATPGLKGN